MAKNEVTSRVSPDANVNSVLNQKGEELDPTVRHKMEVKFGRSFTNVRVHTDPDAAQSARAIQAHAYTAGNHIVFGPGRYSPGTAGGMKTIAHELTHVVQQSSGPVAGNPIAGSLSVSSPEDAFERAAESNAASVMDKSYDTSRVGRPGNSRISQLSCNSRTKSESPFNVIAQITRRAMTKVQRITDNVPAGQLTGRMLGSLPTVIQRQVTIDPKHQQQCDDLLDQIKSVVAELISRAIDLLKDPLNLQWDNWYTPKIFPDGSNAGSVNGHQIQYEGKRNRLRNLIEEWDDNDCNDTGKRVPRDARDLVFAPTPAPIPRPRPDTDPKPWNAPGTEPAVLKKVGTAAEGAAIGAVAGTVVGGIIGGVLGATGGTLVAPGVGTVGGAVGGVAAGAEAGAWLGAAVGTALGGLAGWLTSD